MEALPPMRVWRDLGVVETIYEDEGDYQDSSTTTLSLSPIISSPSPTPTPLRSQVQAWSLASELETDVVIHVEDSCFYLHKAPLRAKSGYLKQLLKDSSELSLSPPLKITAETFSLVTEFCYGTHAVITPFNVAALRIAAELLGMTEGNGAPDGNLLQKTEAYFRRVVAVNQEYASIVLRSCASPLPEAETISCLVSRCIEALTLLDNSDDGVMTSLDDVIKLPPEHFQVVVESMNQRFTNHDLLYRIVDLYLKENTGEITEEQKVRMCNYIDCTALSSKLVMHAVQNPRMPLRFVVQAMFVEQLNTRKSIFSAADQHNRNKEHYHQHQQIEERGDSVTLGAILQRDAALRQVEQLKAAMDTTKSRIQSLEKDLNGMRRLLQESENTNRIMNSIDAGRSQSFRHSSQNKIERGEIGSVSSTSFRVVARKDRARWSPSSEESGSRSSPRVEKKLGRSLINGLKSAFRVPNLVAKKKSEYNATKFEGDEGNIEKYEVGNGEVIVIKKDLPFHYGKSSKQM